MSHMNKAQGRGAPRRRLVAILMVLSSVRRLLTPWQWKQADGHLDSDRADGLGMSQALLLTLGYPLGRCSIVILGPQNTGIIHVVEWRALELEWNNVVDNAAEARKAEGASCIALLIRSPPIFTGSVACVHAGSSSQKCMFVIPLRGQVHASNRIKILSLWIELKAFLKCT